jgi:hypothetical protein
MAETQIIEIQGYGRYEVPDNLTDDELAAVSEEIIQAERDQPLSPTEAISATARGVNVGLVDLPGSFVDLMNQLPVIADYIDPVKLGKSAWNTFVRLGEHHRGVAREEMTPKYKPTYDAKPFTEAPIGGRAQLRRAITDLPVPMGFENIQDLPVVQRPFAQAGQVVGMSAPFAALPYAGARALRAGQKAKGIFGPIVEAAAQKPARAGAQEALAAALSATGSGTAERLAPGDPMARMIGEVAPPFAPLLLGVRALPGVVKSGVKAAQTMLPAGVQRRAAAEIQARMVDEDTSALARQLGAAAEGPLTAAQITGSPYLSSLEKHLIKIDQDAKGVYESRLQESLIASRKKFDEIVAQGDPEAIRQAASDRIAFINEALNRRVARAEEMLAAAADKTTSQADRVQLNTAARGILEDSKKAAKATETELWLEIPRDRVYSAESRLGLPSNTLDAYQTQTHDLLPGEVLDSITHRAIKNILNRSKQKTPPKKPITSGELLRVRSAIRRAQRKSEILPDYARRLNNVIDGIDKDLALMGSTKADTAIAFTKNMSAAFREGMPGKILRRTATGEVDPAVTLTMAYSPREKGMVSYRELREAAGFPLPSATAPGGVEMRRLQEDFLRNLAGETAGFAGNSINPRALETFINKNQAVINDLGLEAQFADTATAAATALRVQKAAKATKSFANVKSFAAKVLKTKDIDKLIENALVAPNKMQEIRRLMKLAGRDRSGKALAGLRYGLFQKILDAATAGEMLSSRALNEVLNAPAVPLSAIPEGATMPTLREALVQERLITPQQNENFDVLLGKLDSFESAVKTPGALSGVLDTEDAMFELLARILGANVGAMSGLSQATGAGLVVAHAGSREARRRLIKVPRFRVKSVMVEAMFNPKLMAKLLEMPVGVSAKAAQQRQINAFLLAAGLRTSQDEETE